MRQLLNVLGADALGKIVLFAMSPILATLARPDEFGSYMLLQAYWSVVMLAQFGGADCALPLRAADSAEDRDQVFAGCSTIAYRALPLVWGAMALFVVSTRPGGALSPLEYALYLSGLLPAGFAIWQLYLLRFARRSSEFAIGTLALRTAAPLAAVIAMAIWPVTSQRLDVFLVALAIGYALAAGCSWWLRRSSLPRPLQCVAPDRLRLYFRTGAVLLPGSLAYAAIWASDRIVANALLGPTAAGIIGVAALFGSTVLLLKVWLGLIWDPLVVEWAGKGAQPALAARIRRGFDWATIGFLSVATLGVIWAPMVVRFIYPAELAVAADLLLWYFAAAGIAGIGGIASATTLIARNPHAHLAVQLVALGACVLTMVVAVPRLSLHGIAAGILAAEVTILCGWLYLAIWRFRNLPLRVGHLFAAFSAFGSIAWGCTSFSAGGMTIEVLSTLLLILVAASFCYRLSARRDREVFA